MMNMNYVPAMNRMMAEDVNVPALRNPMIHLGRKQRKESRAEEPRTGWIDAQRAIRAHR